MKKRIASLFLLACALLPWGAKAERLPTDSTVHEDKAKSSLFAVPPPQTRFHNVTMTTRSIGVGGVLLGDTYLTPLSYGGTHFSFVSWLQEAEGSLACSWVSLCLYPSHT